MLRALVFSGLFFLIGCKPTLTCNTSLEPTKAGCPGSDICDPSGVCRQRCTEGGPGNGGCSSDQACDNTGQGTAVNYTSICQELCDSNTPCPSINGNTQVCYQVTPAAPTGSTAQSFGICKRVISNNGCNDVGQVQWCNSQYGLVCTNVGGTGLCLPSTSP